MAQKQTAFVTHSDCSRHDTGWEHPDHQGRLPAVARAVYRDMLTLFEPLLELEGAPATEEELLLVHEPGYLERVRAGAAAAAAEGRVVELAEGTRVSAASWEAAVAAVGCGLTAVDAVLRGEVRNAFCAVRPPGGGAGRDGSDGLALFNTVAVAAADLRRRRGLERVLVVEWAARPGAGTPELLADDPGVRLARVYAGDPAAAADFDRPVPPGAAGAAVADALGRALDAATDGWTPDFVLLAAGFDLLAGDPLGTLAVLPDEVHGLTRALLERAERWCGGRVVSVLEGGYEPTATGRAVVQHLRALAGLEPA